MSNLIKKFLYKLLIILQAVANGYTVCYVGNNNFKFTKLK